MNYNFTTSIMYKDIFKTESDWLSFLSQYTTCTNPDSVTLLALYLRNNYYNSSINYDTPDAFKRHFGITFSNLYPRYIKQLEIINKVNNINDNDILEMFRSISNLSNYNGEAVAAPLDTVLEYINSQSSNKTTANKLTTYIDAIYRMTDNLVYEFLNEFKKHFIKVFYQDIITEEEN